MNFGGFGKNSGPNNPLRAQTPIVNFPRSPSPPVAISPRSPVDYSDLGASDGASSSHLSSRLFPGTLKSNEPPLSLGDVQASSFKEYGAQTYQRSPGFLPQIASSNPRTTPSAKSAEVQYIERTNSPYSQSPNEISKNSRRVIEGDKSYLVPYQGRSPPLVSRSNQYVDGPLPQTQVPQHPFSSSTWGNNQLKVSSSVLVTKGSIQSEPIFEPKYADASIPKRTRSPTPSPTSVVSPENTVSYSGGHKRSLINYRDLDAPEPMPSPHLGFTSNPFSRESSRTFAGNEKPFPSHARTGQSEQSIDTIRPLIQEDMSTVSTTSGAYQSGRTLQTKHAVIPSPKRTRSPKTPSPGGVFLHNPAVSLNGHQIASDFRSQSLSSMSGQIKSPEVSEDRPMNFPALKRTKIPHQSSSDQVFEENLDPSLESERELLAKEKRLARFKNELSQPVQSHSTVRNQKVPVNRHHSSMPNRQNVSDDPADARIGDAAEGNVSSDYDGMSSSSSIVGLCPDMCPESERAERGRKGDLDQYERLDGDRNVTSEFLAVKKYTRTAEREALLIRPMSILQKTMNYLLGLLDEPYDDRFLGLYNFLWDRMRAIRMDLRMQHIFNIEAINLLEQMIRLHIIAMHELCEYTKGEGFSEGFDAHLNIEQMNKTSVELFQLYDDHRKKGIHVPSEREFRGYYALLKLDKHPGYKVEPAELSLDLAKMTPEMRQTPEILFARDVARACRTGNFIAFFRLARKSSYLQACLMHAHFSKLRTQALASLHCGLQMNQGIPITLVAKWLGMEEEDIENLLEYHGFSVKDFEEPYMVKENTFINIDNDFPVKRSKLVNRKKSRKVVRDVSFPSRNKLSADVEVKGFLPKKKVPESKPTPPKQSVVPVSTTHLHDEEMRDSCTTILSPKGTMKNQMDNMFSTAPTTPVKELVGHENVQLAPASPLGFDFSNSSSQSRVELSHALKFEPVFRNSFGKLKPKQAAEEPISLETPEENRLPVLPFDSVVHTPIQQPRFTEDLEGDDEQTSRMEEDKSDEVVVTYYDKEVEEAKLKLMLRIWKRHAAKKRELREHKQLTAHAALSSLSVGPPIWKFEVQSGSFSTFNIDHVIRERHEIREKSWSVLNPSEVVVPKLVEKNPDANYLCWKLLLLSPHEVDMELPNESASLSAASSWLHSKLMPENNDVDGNLLVSSPDLSIWSTWVPSQSGLDLTCCFSVIKKITTCDQIESTTGVSAVIFVLSDHIPIELQKERLRDIVMSLPSDSRLPLLIVSSSSNDESEIAKVLGLDEIYKSRVILSYISFFKNRGSEKLHGVFLSDECLREGLEWLASQTPPQITIRGIKTRDLVLSHLNSTLEILNGMSNIPSNCIGAFNEALNRSMVEVAHAVRANPTAWPCPEIDMLDESRYFPSIGWSSASKTQVLMNALDNLKLPALEDDLFWLSKGIRVDHDIENQKSLLENCLIKYLTNTSRMMGLDLAHNEANIVLQKSMRLELRDTTYYIVPDWVSIFKRVFSWRLMSLTSGEVSSTYVLVKRDDLPGLSSEAVLDKLESKVNTFLPPYVVNPSFDELVEVGGFESNNVEYEDCQVPPMAPSFDELVEVGGFESNNVEYEDCQVPPMALDCVDDVRTSYGNVKLVENENVSGESDDGGPGMREAKASREANTLGELLEKCNILQNLIDEKLSIYF